MAKGIWANKWITQHNAMVVAWKAHFDREETVRRESALFREADKGLYGRSYLEASGEIAENRAKQASDAVRGYDHV